MITQELLDAALNGGCNTPRYLGDCERIVRVAAEHGLSLSVHSAERIWSWHSDNYCAGWLMMSDESDEMIWDTLRSYVSYHTSCN